MQVCGRKTRGPENLLSLDTAAFKEVTKEDRDVSGLGSREVLVARDVLHREGVNGCVWRGCGPSVEMNVNISLCVLHSLGGFTCATWKKKKGRTIEH